MRELTKHEKATLKNIFEELKKCELFIGKYDAKMVMNNLCMVFLLSWNV